MFSYNKFKFKYQRYAIPHLSGYIAITFAIGYLISVSMPQLYTLLVFAPYEVLHGQIWRIITTVFFPPMGGSFLWTALAIYVYYSMGSTLEHWWGSFNFNVYFFASLLVSEIGVTVFYRSHGLLSHYGTEYSLHPGIYVFLGIHGLCHHLSGGKLPFVLCDPGKGKVSGHCGSRDLYIQFLFRRYHRQDLYLLCHDPRGGLFLYLHGRRKGKLLPEH